MNIAFAGCSYTVGTELQKPEETRWSKILCNELNATEHNYAKTGSSNEEICLSVFENVLELDKLDFLVVQFTSSLRFSIATNDSIVSFSPNKSSKNSYEKILSKVLYLDFDPVLWYRLFRWKAVALHHLLNANNINHMFVFMTENESVRISLDNTIPKSFKDRSLFVGLREYCTNNNLEMGKNHHPLEEASSALATKLILPRMKRLL